MYKNRSTDGKNNICGKKVSEFRLKLPEKTSQRFVTDIELKALAKVLGVTYEDLLND